MIRFISLLFVGTFLLPAVEAKTTYQLPRVSQTPNINGVLEANEWTDATRVQLAYNIDPGNSIPAPVKTTAYMMEDGVNLYIAFFAEDPDPERILAYIRDRDSIFQDDFVGIIIDTFNDERKGFEFFVNPMGSQGDLTRDDTHNNEDSSWDTVWDSAGQVVENGYIVEMAIPFRALRFTPELSQQTWGIQFLRVYPRDSRMVIADNPTDRKLDCTLCQVNKVTGMPLLKADGTNLDLTPTLTYVNREERDVDPIGDWQKTSDEFDLGLDLRWAMTEDWILNATLNPDFSQVEADVGQLDVNTTFSLFYPESRPFFLEGADYFKSMNNLVHTRNIADPDIGLKVTGKTNGYSGGLIVASDESTSILIPSSLGSYVAELENQTSEVVVARGQADWGKKNNIGVVMTHRAGGDYQNQLVSLDGKYYFTEKDVFNYQVMHSSSDNPESIQFEEDCDRNSDPEGCVLLLPHQSDQSLSLNYRHNEEDYSIRATYNDFGKDFRADMGFVGQVDYRKLILGGDYVWRGKEGSKWTRWGFFGDWDKTEDQSGLKLEQETESYFFINGPMQFKAEAGFLTRERYFDEQYFDETQYTMWFEVKPHDSLTLGNFLRVGDQIDFTHSQLGEVSLFEPYLKWQINKHFTINLRTTFQSLDVPGGELFSADLIDLRLAYQFSIRSRLSLTLQSTEIDRNLSLYEDNQDSDPDNDYLARERSFATQLIYSYKINPQSLFYLGYSDNGMENDDVLSLTKTDRTFFAKFSYLWQH